jgi:hypothetical protein
MTVKELRDILSDYSDDMVIIVEAKNGYKNISEVRAIQAGVSDRAYPPIGVMFVIE